MNTIIESLGVHLPARSVTTEEILRGCRKPLAFPLERMTGIRSRHVAGDGEFAVDLAARALEACLARSRFAPDEVDLLICCNISRYDGPCVFSFEPSTSMTLKARFGLRSALAFDVNNACTGMFTGILIADALLNSGAARCAVVVSGEYISHLARTAQQELDGVADPRLACLTLGDAGAALTLEVPADGREGFQALDLYTLGRYASLCVGKITDQAHGGAIMLTDAMRSSAIAIEQAIPHAAHVLERHGWPAGEWEHLIMHQTSETALRGAAREIDRFYGRPVCRGESVVHNLAERGNTATTTHFVAVWDLIRSGRIRSGDRVVFGLSGSGQTVGTALYVFDDLPDRMRAEPCPTARPAVAPAGGRRVAPAPATRVRIGAVGVLPATGELTRDSVELLRAAAAECLADWPGDRSDLDLVIHAGVYRNEYISEPAIAAMLAGALGINDAIASQDERKTFAFDVLNGSLGFLNACHVAATLIGVGRFRRALVAAAEIENNAHVRPHALRGVRETASALVLEDGGEGGTGFGRFHFADFPEHVGALRVYAKHEEGQVTLRVERAGDVEALYLELIPDVVGELLEAEGIGPAQVGVVLAPQISTAFLRRLAGRLGVAPERMVDVTEGGADLFTSSLPCAFHRVRAGGLAAPGDVGLVVGAGAGLQVGCAIYHF